MDTRKLINTKDLSRSKIEFKEEIEKLYNEAYNYLKNQNWCIEVLDSWFDRGLADKLAVFYFKIIPCKGADEYVWIITGDIPHAYIDTESAPNGACAIKVYSEIMEDWIKAVKDSENMNKVFPIDIPASEKYANMLSSRIKFIRKNLLPMYLEELKEC
jgi:hypothetical protein